MRSCLAGALLAVCLAGAARGAEFRSVEMERDGDQYRLSSEVFVDAPRTGVYGILTDYAAFPQLSSVFRSGEVLEPVEHGRGLVYLLMRGCVLFFCKEVAVVQTIVVEPDKRIEAIVDPRRSDLDYGRAVWTLRDDGSGTLIRYEALLQPQFWIPPIIGPFVIKTAIRTRGLRAAQRLEALAAGRPIPEALVVEGT
jgi:hypothetical protein